MLDLLARSRFDITPFWFWPIACCIIAVVMSKRARRRRWRGRFPFPMGSLDTPRRCTKPTCGELNPPVAMFCRRCGTPLIEEHC